MTPVETCQQIRRNYWRLPDELRQTIREKHPKAMILFDLWNDLYATPLKASGVCLLKCWEDIEKALMVK